MKQQSQKSLINFCVPFQVDQFSIICNLGSGGQGSVFLGNYRGKKIVIKIYFKVSYFEKEIISYQKLNQLNSPLFCHMLQYRQQMRVKYQTKMVCQNLSKKKLQKDFDEIQQINLSSSKDNWIQVQLPVLILEHVQGISLSNFYGHNNICYQCQKMSLSLCGYIFRQIVQAIKLLSEIDISHRDIKQANILLLPTGEIKLIDFGISVEYSFTGKNPKTRIYLTPEAIRGEVVTSETIDLFAAHVTLYRLFVSKPPFEPQSYQIQPILKHWDQMQYQLQTALKNKDHFYRYMVKNLGDNSQLARRRNILERDTLQHLYNCIVLQNSGMEKLKWFEQLLPFNLKEIEKEIRNHLRCMYKKGMKDIIHHTFSVTFGSQLEADNQNEEQNLIGLPSL